MYRNGIKVKWRMIVSHWFIQISIDHNKGWFQRLKALSGFFLCIFSPLTYLKKPVFSKRDLLRWKVPASLLLFLKSEKIPTLLEVGKGPEYRPFRNLNLFLGLPASGTNLKSLKGLYSSPSPIYIRKGLTPTNAADGYLGWQTHGCAELLT